MILLFTLSCVSIKNQAEVDFEFAGTEVNPLDCLNIELKSDGVIEKQLIHESSIMKNCYLLVLTYCDVTTSGELDKSKNHDNTRIYFISELEEIDNTTLVHEQHFIVELWKTYQNHERKTCLQWTLWESNATLKLLIEKADGTFISERNIRISDEECASLKAFYKDLEIRFLSIYSNRKSLFEAEKPILLGA